MEQIDYGRAGMNTQGKYDPIEKAREVSEVVCTGNMRKYYRFRPAPFYGGIATADCVGCCLTCLFCWAWNKVTRPEAHGILYSPRQVAEKLVGIARKKGYRRVRISGNEPTLCRDHLLGVLELIPGDILFILETNGIPIGHDKTYAQSLARFENVHVRVSLKGCDEKEFSLLTGAQERGFTLQIQALQNLAQAGVSAHPAVMSSFSPWEKVADLKERLREIDLAYADLEIEGLILYRDVRERLDRAHIPYHDAYSPRKV